jgi:putative oxidoreductase
MLVASNECGPSRRGTKVAMSLPAMVARPLLAGMFVYGGLDSFRNPEPKVPAAQKVVGQVEDMSGGSLRTAHLIQANGALQVVAGAALATGRWARPAALALALSLIPTTLAGHRFWEQETAADRHAQRIQFLKNLAMLGGLVLAAADTGGRPSLPWRARRAVGATVERARQALPGS